MQTFAEKSNLTFTEFILPNTHHFCCFFGFLLSYVVSLYSSMPCYRQVDDVDWLVSIDIIEYVSSSRHNESDKTQSHHHSTCKIQQLQRYYRTNNNPVFIDGFKLEHMSRTDWRWCTNPTLAWLYREKRASRASYVVSRATCQIWIFKKSRNGSYSFSFIFLTNRCGL